ncbi:hypothetical protein QJS10_CPB19g00694 [Acorus calamus]|uniref:Uncharacterized protein n=1 Tax=Acorus calamus TaxID=4465 RepID=A0AAV9CIJ6_ACOCL|nr:hypothetical protein QJS10_CPB19g00694 [Acorus calamus]
MNLHSCPIAWSKREEQGLERWLDQGNNQPAKKMTREKQTVPSTFSHGGGGHLIDCGMKQGMGYDFDNFGGQDGWSESICIWRGLISPSNIHTADPSSDRRDVFTSFKVIVLESNSQESVQDVVTLQTPSEPIPLEGLQQIILARNDNDTYKLATGYQHYEVQSVGDSLLSNAAPGGALSSSPAGKLVVDLTPAQNEETMDAAPHKFSHKSANPTQPPVVTGSQTDLRKLGGSRKNKQPPQSKKGGVGSRKGNSQQTDLIKDFFRDLEDAHPSVDRKADDPKPNSPSVKGAGRFSQ